MSNKIHCDKCDAVVATALWTAKSPRGDEYHFCGKACLLVFVASYPNHNHRNGHKHLRDSVDLLLGWQADRDRADSEAAGRDILSMYAK